MALYTTTTNVSGITPDDIGQLVVQPVERESIAIQTATVVTTSSTHYRVPLVTADPSAAWVAEGAEITPSDATIDEIDIAPPKLAGLTIISRELADDSSPAAQEIVGQGLARDIARKLDQAYFSAVASPAPAGLTTVVGFGDTATGGTAWANLDAFSEAISDAEQVGAQLTAFVANPADALAISKLKDETGSNRPLLGVDPSVATKRSIQGITLWTSPYVAAGVVWGIPQARVQVVMRDNTRLEVDRSVFFTSDRVAVKATMRVGFAFVHPAAIQKIRLATT